MNLMQYETARTHGVDPVNTFLPFSHPMLTDLR